MKIRQAFKNKILFVYFVSTALVLLGSGILLRDQWLESIQKSKIIATKDLAISSITANNILLNGSKLLDATNRELHQLIVENKYQTKNIQQTIASAASLFSLNKELQNYGLLLVVDRAGNLVTRSDGTATSGLNFSDRQYFQELKNNPGKSFAIGPLLQARTTKKRIFHIATPIRDLKGQFYGTLTLQINENSISKIVNLAISNDNESITAVSNNGEIIFSTLQDQLHPNSNSALKFSETFQNVNLNANASEKNTGGLVITQLDFPEFQLKYISVQSIEKLFLEFLKSNEKVFAFATISYLIFSYLMWFIYRQFMQAEKARVLSSTDPLTQLPNRRAFDERYELFLKDSIRTHSNISVLFIDIDKFKNCNDDYGHENGDLVLKCLADTIHSCMRRPLDFCCRWGGEELVALLPDTDEAGASEVAEHILDTVRKTPIQINGFPPIYITVSIGIACAHHHQNKVPENNLVDRADQAMYRAKQGGRDRYSL